MLDVKMKLCLDDYIHDSLGLSMIVAGWNFAVAICQLTVHLSVISIALLCHQEVHKRHKPAFLRGQLATFAQECKSICYED